MGSTATDMSAVPSSLESKQFSEENQEKLGEIVFAKLTQI